MGDLPSCQVIVNHRLWIYRSKKDYDPTDYLVVSPPPYTDRQGAESQGLGTQGDVQREGGGVRARAGDCAEHTHTEKLAPTQKGAGSGVEIVAAKLSLVLALELPLNPPALGPSDPPAPVTRRTPSTTASRSASPCGITSGSPR
jgi:hypothetical protein